MTDPCSAERFAVEGDEIVHVIEGPAVSFRNRFCKAFALAPLSVPDLGNKRKVHALQVVQIESERPAAIAVDIVIFMDLVPEVVVPVPQLVIAPRIPLFTIFLFPGRADAEIRIPVSFSGKGKGIARSGIPVPDFNLFSALPFPDAQDVLIVVPLVADVICVIEDLIALSSISIPADLEFLIPDAGTDLHIAVKFQRPHFRIVAAHPEAG